MKFRIRHENLARNIMTILLFMLIAVITMALIILIPICSADKVGR